MQYKLSHLPLLKIVLPFMAGIFFFDVFTIPFFVGIATTTILFFFIFINHFAIKNIVVRHINSIAIYVLLFMLGGLLILHKNFNNQQQHFSTQTGIFATGMIVKPIEAKEKTYKTVVQINKCIDSTNKVKYATGNVLLYIKKDSSISNLEIGDEILFPIKTNAIEAPKNPGQFDYQKFLNYKSIYHQAYLSQQMVMITQKHKTFFIQRISNNIGNYVQAILKKYIPERTNFNLADGILLGHRADIDAELYNAFAYTGIMHILSVSGLHVGIIYAMLVFLLSFIKDKNRKIKIFKFVFIFCFIWLFTFITGFSAACVRASILFSLLNFGKLSKENVSNLNLLAGAALIQLLIDPNVLFDIGFQLSYLAMLGLFIFTKPIYSLYFSKNKLIDWTWKLWSASIAAQLFTVPLSIYYFGNFPTYFLLANVFAIPLSAVILWLSVALIPFSFIPFLAKIIGWIDAFVISIFIRLTYFFSNLPLGKLYNIYISKTQLIILLIAICCLAYFEIQRKSKYLVACLCLFLITIGISFAYNIRQLKNTQHILYSVPKNFVLALNKNGHQILFAKDSISEKTFSYSIKNSHRIFRIKDMQTYFLKDSLNLENAIFKNNLLVLNNKSFYFLTKNNTRKAFSTPLNIDYLILSDNCYLNIENIKTNFHYRHLIISSDNDNYHINIFKKLLSENKLHYMDLNAHSLELK